MKGRQSRGGGHDGHPRRSLIVDTNGLAIVRSMIEVGGIGRTVEIRSRWGAAKHADRGSVDAWEVALYPNLIIAHPPCL